MMSPIDFLIRKNFFSSQKNSFFVYDQSALVSAIQKIKFLSHQSTDLYYSVKANPNPDVLADLNAAGINFDVSSVAELQFLIRLGVAPERMTFSGPAKTDLAIREVIKHKIKSIHLDSLEEFDLLKESGLSLSLRVPLEDSYSQKLGIPMADLVQLLKNSKEKFEGLHVYLGRERAQKQIIDQYLQIVTQIYKDHQQAFKGKPNLYWGGGFPAQTFLKAEMMPMTSDFNLHLEAGRALSHESGYWGTRVLAVKPRTPLNIIVNGGLQYLASKFSSPQYGQEGLKTFFVSSENVPLQAQVNRKANIFGSLGIWHDLLAQDIDVPEDLKRGDWIVFNPAGAYGLSAGVNQFLGPDPVDEYYLKNNSLIKSEKLAVMSYLESGLDESRRAD